MGIFAVASERLRNGIAAVVAGVWSLAAIAGILTQDYTGLGIVTPVMMLIGGFLFGIKHEEKKQKENGQGYPEIDRRRRSDDLSDW